MITSAENLSWSGITEIKIEETYVTEFWKITLAWNNELATILLTSQKHILNISTLFLVIQSIFNVLET